MEDQYVNICLKKKIEIIVFASILFTFESSILINKPIYYMAAIVRAL